MLMASGGKRKRRTKGGAAIFYREHCHKLSSKTCCDNWAEVGDELKQHWEGQTRSLNDLW